MSIKEQAAKSVFWSAAERFSVQGIQFVLTLVIARILSPDAYGLVAMLGIFMALSQVLVDSGFANALIQKKDRTETDYSTAFYFNAAGSLLIYLCLFVCAPLIARFFAEPQLTVIARVIGLTLVINSLGIVQQARLTVDLDFKRLARASLGAVAISGAVGIWLAYHGFGVWTLVWQSLLNSLLRVVFLMDIFSLDASLDFLMAVVSCTFLFRFQTDAGQPAAHFLCQLLFPDYRKVLFGFPTGVLQPFLHIGAVSFHQLHEYCCSCGLSHSVPLSR